MASGPFFIIRKIIHDSLVTDYYGLTSGKPSSFRDVIQHLYNLQANSVNTGNDSEQQRQAYNEFFKKTIAFRKLKQHQDASITYFPRSSASWDSEKSNIKEMLLSLDDHTLGMLWQTNMSFQDLFSNFIATQEKIFHQKSLCQQSYTRNELCPRCQLLAESTSNKKKKMMDFTPLDESRHVG